MPAAACPQHDLPQLTGARRVGESLQTLAGAALMLCVVSRMFVTEHTFRVPPPALQDLSRATHAVVLLAACGLWLIGAAVAGGAEIRHKPLVCLVGAFTLNSLVSATRASDTRGAMLVWWEQAVILSAGVLAVQVFADRRRRGLLLCLLAAGAATVAAKGLLQVYDEFPATIASLNESPDLVTEMFGWEAGSTPGHLLRLRLGSMAPTGFYWMSNVLASLLLLAGAAAVGVLADRIADFVAAVGRRRRGQADSDVTSPLAGAIVCIVPVALAAVVLVMTRSAAAVGAGALAGAAGIAVALFRRPLGRHWRAAVLAVAVLGALAVAATVAYGLSRDRLPTKTMTVRWYYWTASADIIRDEPLWGVGGENFRDAYLLRRRAEAEESVKDPHNVAVSAVSQYGLLGGATYLAALLYVLVAMCRPRASGPEPPASGIGLSNGLIACAAVAAVLVTRGLLGDGFATWEVAVWQSVIPAAVFALVLAGLVLGGRNVAGGEAARFGRIALACGAAAFAAHNMVSFSLWAPTTATVFWVVVGALLAGGGASAKPIVRARWPAAVAGAAVVTAAVVLLWQPIWRQTALWRQADRSLRTGDVRGALAASQAAAETWNDPVCIAAAVIF